MFRPARLAAALLPLLAAPALAQTTLRIGIGADPNVLDPAQSGSFVERVVFSALCDKLVDVGPDLKFRAELATAWSTLSDRLHHLLGNAQESGMEISRAEFENLLHASERRASHTELHALIEQLGHERVAPRLRRTGEQARDLARRLGLT